MIATVYVDSSDLLKRHETGTFGDWQSRGQGFEPPQLHHLNWWPTAGAGSLPLPRQHQPVALHHDRAGFVFDHADDKVVANERHGA